MASNFRRTVTDLETSIPNVRVRVWVAYDHAYGGYYCAATSMTLEKGILYGHPFTAYATRWMAEGFRRASSKKLVELVDLARKQLGERSGIAWDVIEEILSKEKFTIPGAKPQPA